LVVGASGFLQGLGQPVVAAEGIGEHNMNASLNTYERTACAQDFLTNNLTSRERELVIAFALGYSQADLVRVWHVSAPAVSQMVSRIYRKAAAYWI
jgi:DNA-binding NarL/FixJ family response regulator